MNKSIFLGGTCGSNRWREDIVIPGLLERGVAPEQIFNPVVEHWDEQAQAREDAAKADPANLLLWVLASPDPNVLENIALSAYSMVETTISAFVAPERSLVLIDATGMAKRTAKSLNKAAQDWHQVAPGMPIYRDYALLLDDLAARLREG